MTQVREHTESKRRQYDLVQSAQQLGFVAIDVIDEDLGRSGSGYVERPGFQRLVSQVCSGEVGAIFCIEASRLARNGGEWYHLIDLCAVVGTLVVDPDGVYDPRCGSDRMLLGMKGTMSEYELSILRQRGLEARNSKAKRGELRFGLPAGYCWDAFGKLGMDADERIVDAIQLVFRKFRELRSARQVTMWMRENEAMLPVTRPNERGFQIEWRIPSYSNVHALIAHPIYAGAYTFGRKKTALIVANGQARKRTVKERRERWSVLIRDHHAGFISWEEYERNTVMLSENAHRKQRPERKTGRGGRALLSGLLRCGRCGLMMRVAYGSPARDAHTYLCSGETETDHGACLRTGGFRVDRAVSNQLLEAVQPHAVAAAIDAEHRLNDGNADRLRAIQKELEHAQYEARLAARRYEAVDPEKRLVARELEARWEAALERVREGERRVLDVQTAVGNSDPLIDRALLERLANDLPRLWNAPSTDPRHKQRIAAVLIREVIIDKDETANETIVTIHWMGGRHTQLRVARNKRPSDADRPKLSAIVAIRKLAGRCSDRDIAMTLNRLRCKRKSGRNWTVHAVKAARDKLGAPEFDAMTQKTTVSAAEAAARLGICANSISKLIRDKILPGLQVIPCAPWEIPVEALDTEPVRIAARASMKRRPRNIEEIRDQKHLRFPGF